MEGFRKTECAPQPNQNGEKREKIKDRSPAEPFMEPAAEHRSDRGRDGENHRDLRHHALPVMTFVNIPHHRASDDESSARGDPLQRAKKPEYLNGWSQRAADGSQ